MSAFLAVLQEVFMGLFDNVLKPVLVEVAKFIINALIDILVDTLSWVLYFAWTAILKVVEQLSIAFEYFAGTSRGLVNGNQTVLEVMFNLDIVSKMFVMFTAVGVAISLIFSIINVVKSMSDMTLEDKNPISKVMANTLKSLVTFIVIPLLCIFMLRLSTIVVDTIDSTVNKDGGVTVDRVIWYNCSLNASTTPENNIDGKMTEAQKEILLSGNESTRVNFYKRANNKDPESYMYEDVRNNANFKFDYGKFDYAQGFASAIIMMLVLIGCIMVFVARLFELIVLYIVGPIFAATIANDGGEMFKQWKELFIAKFIGGYSMVLGMRLYLIIIPVISSGKIIFTSTEIAGFDGKFNAFVQLLIVVGGGYAVYKSQHMILRLLSYEASAQAQEAGAMALGTAMGAANTGKASVMGFGAGIIGAFRSNKGGQGDEGGEEGKEKKKPEEKKSSGSSSYNSESNRFDGARPK